MMDMSADPGQQQAGEMISPNDVEWVYEVIRGRRLSLICCSRPTEPGFAVADAAGNAGDCP